MLKSPSGASAPGFLSGEVAPKMITYSYCFQQKTDSEPASGRCSALRRL